MRNHEAEPFVGERHRVEINRIGESHIEMRGKTELAPNANRQNAAVDEHQSAWLPSHDLQDRRDALVANAETVHRRKETDRMQPAPCECLTDAVHRACRSRVYHEVP